MIYLEYNITIDGDTGTQAIELSCETIAAAATLFIAYQHGYEHGCPADVKLELTSIGTSKKRGVEYKRWSGL